MHQTHIFIVLDTGQVEPLPQARYVKLLRGELQLPHYANRSVRIADWYVEVKEGRPVAIANETYSLVHLDERGQVRWPHERSWEAPQPGVLQRSDQFCLFRSR